ncbi:helix-turn-helix transcriptional regulator [Haloarchaeobius sp. HRN-SO-5]|uniref:helix-turn-helix transcriptional regulator n=1 Tax=Haloarchaeobius sp. HRN-SO-5 TaxID=3446118 RepID=UPI003EB7A2D4
MSIAVVGLLLGGMVAPVATADVAQQTQPETDNTVTRIEIDENGSARWTIQIRTRLDTDQRVDEYAAFQARFRNDTSQYLGPFRDRMQGVVANAANVTGREMRATDFTASTSIQEVPRRWGSVTYEFTWTNLAAQQNGRLVVGDVFQGGFFIAANDTLQLVAPTEYEIGDTEPEPDSLEGDVVTWNGREDFSDAHPRVVFAPASGQHGPSDETDDDVGSPLEDLGGPVVLGVAVVGLLGLVAVVVSRQRDGTTGGTPGEPTVESGAAPPPTDEREGAPEETESAEAVMTDEERVLDLLEANGGRMRQAAIAERFDWSASKTSRIVGKLADGDAVEKLQLGRENLVDLVDDE